MVTCCMRGGSGKEMLLSRTLRSWKIWTRQKSMLGDSTQSRFSPHTKENNSYSLSRMEQLSWQEEHWYSEHPLKLRISLNEERNTTMFFKEKRTGLIQTNQLMALKPGANSGVFLGIIFIVITCNQESNSTRQMKGHSLCHSNILMLSGGQKRHWTCCWKVASTTIGVLFPPK